MFILLALHYTYLAIKEWFLIKGNSHVWYLQLSMLKGARRNGRNRGNGGNSENAPRKLLPHIF